MRFISFLFLFLIVFKSNAGSGFVMLKDTTRLFYVSDNEIYSPDKNHLLYFSKGNIFFPVKAMSGKIFFCTVHL